MRVQGLRNKLLKSGPRANQSNIKLDGLFRKKENVLKTREIKKMVSVIYIIRYTTLAFKNCC
jgi:hypothetical protein